MAIFCAPALGPVISLLVGGKVLAYAASVITAPTNQGTRELVVGHVEHVITALDKAGIGIPQAERASLEEDIALLRNAAEVGWTEEYESLALARVLGFLSKAHVKSTGLGLSAFATAHGDALAGRVTRFGKSVWENITRTTA